MVTRLDHRKAFVQRLNRACDESPMVPAHRQGRQRMIADRLGASQETVSKWFKAVAIPQPDLMRKLAEFLGVDYSWLALGVEPEIPKRVNRLQDREYDGAVHLVWGMLSLAGAECGTPAKNDPRTSYVDFYATLRGAVFPIHVAMAHEISSDHFEVVLPRDYDAVRCICVVPAGVGKYHFIDLVGSQLKDHTKTKGTVCSMSITRVDASRYVTGSAQWPRIKSFGELR